MLFLSLPQSFLQMNTIFISILIEALPFVVLGVFMAGMIQIFVSEELVARVMPKNPILAVLFASFLGALFPACECGIVPIVRRLVSKGVPIYAGIAFMLTGPIINPVVLFSTYVAFGSNWTMPLYRAGGALAVSVVVGLILAFFYKGDGLKITAGHHHSLKKLTVKQKIGETLNHAVEEFFSMGKYLVVGSLIAAAVQTYVKTSTLLAIGQGQASSSLVMMGLAFVLSLCSEADAFIASSFRSTFSTGSIVAFLVFGPMLDMKNLLMMLGTFKTKLVLIIVTSLSVVVFLYSLLF
ncbi:permease [Fictibacillus terranigra]|uniref:Permease n=1 Tax=Fictibacillus terranigra TaxID=3058424 RepID=A0ABT8E7D6_9BACL|nr:permease [Fictibacillus sp. CENA-BCM004]MDN4073805.1 permease [Fictibacillus sp. CENA-BCM004]